MGNNSVKKSEETLIKKFYMDDRKFPCFLKENGEGDFIEYTGGFEDISFKKYHPKKENTFSKQDLKSDLSSENIYKLDFDSFMDVAIFHSDGGLLRSINNIRNYSVKKEYLVLYFKYSLWCALDKPIISIE